MQLVVRADPEETAAAAACFVARQAAASLARQSRYVLALSGGNTGVLLLQALLKVDIAWARVEVVQVDERLAPADDPARNFLQLRRYLVDQGPLPETQIHPLPVAAPDPAVACADYQALLERLAGRPVVLDLAHLGLGDDGHTASLVPDDPLLLEGRHLVGMTAGEYRGYRRMTLTYPLLNRARRLLWLTTGAEKSTMLRQLFAGDLAQPAGRIRRSASIIFADRAAAADLPS